MNDVDIMKHIDQIILHTKAIKILRDPKITLIKAQEMIDQMFMQYEDDSEDYYPEKELDSCCESMAKSDLQELIEDDNRERSRDMNAVNRSPF